MNTVLKKAIEELRQFTSGNPIIATQKSVDDSGYVYTLDIYVRTISGCGPVYTNSVRLRLRLPLGYPDESPAVTAANIFHPNFLVDGHWMDSEQRAGETISDYLYRLVRVLQFKEINEEAVGSRNAMAWYHANKENGLFPTDRINYRSQPRIVILDRPEPEA